MTTLCGEVIVSGVKGAQRHGLSKLPEHNIWRAMKKRCYSEYHPHYADYGGRGIKVCERWVHNFLAFYNDMGPRPVGMTLDRRDNDGDYEPGNCRWATRSEQQLNRRRPKLSRRNRFGILGVGWATRKNAYQVQISINGKNRVLGVTQDFFDACCLRKSAENRLLPATK